MGVAKRSSESMATVTEPSAVVLDPAAVILVIDDNFQFALHAWRWLTNSDGFGYQQGLEHESPHVFPALGSGRLVVWVRADDTDPDEAMEAVRRCIAERLVHRSQHASIAGRALFDVRGRAGYEIEDWIRAFERRFKGEACGQNGESDATAGALSAIEWTHARRVSSFARGPAIEPKGADLLEDVERQLRDMQGGESDIPPRAEQETPWIHLFVTGAGFDVAHDFGGLGTPPPKEMEIGLLREAAHSIQASSKGAAKADASEMLAGTTFVADLWVAGARREAERSEAQLRKLRVLPADRLVLDPGPLESSPPAASLLSATAELDTALRRAGRGSVKRRDALDAETARVGSLLSALRWLSMHDPRSEGSGDAIAQWIRGSGGQAASDEAKQLCAYLWWDDILDHAIQRLRDVTSSGDESANPDHDEALAEARVRALVSRFIAGFDFGVPRAYADTIQLPIHVWVTTNYTSFVDRALQIGRQRLDKEWRVVSTEKEVELVGAMAVDPDLTPDNGHDAHSSPSLYYKLHGEVAHWVSMAVAHKDKRVHGSEFPRHLSIVSQYNSASSQLVKRMLRAARSSRALTPTRRLCIHVIGQSGRDGLLNELLSDALEVAECSRIILVDPYAKSAYERMKSAIPAMDPGQSSRDHSVVVLNALGVEYVGWLRRTDAINHASGGEPFRGWNDLHSRLMAASEQ